MAIKNSYRCLFSCIAILLNVSCLHADELDDLVNTHEVKTLQLVKRDTRATDIATTEIVSTKQIKSKNVVIKESIVAEHSDDAIGAVLLQAMSLMGISYKWGGNTPQTGMDCSGFIRYVFQKSTGITLPRTAAEMARVGKRVRVENIEPGDLIFFNTLHGRRNSHVGMYIGNDQFIQSPRTGQRIQISDYNSYWRSHTNGVKRVIEQDTDQYGNSEVKELVSIHNEALPSGSIRTTTVHKKSRKSIVKVQRKNKQLKQNSPIKTRIKIQRSSTVKIKKSSSANLKKKR